MNNFIIFCLFFLVARTTSSRSTPSVTSSTTTTSTTTSSTTSTLSNTTSNVTKDEANDDDEAGLFFQFIFSKFNIDLIELMDSIDENVPPAPDELDQQQANVLSFFYSFVFVCFNISLFIFSKGDNANNDDDEANEAKADWYICYTDEVRYLILFLSLCCLFHLFCFFKRAKSTFINQTLMRQAGSKLEFNVLSFSFNYSLNRLPPGMHRALMNLWDNATAPNDMQVCVVYLDQFLFGF